MDQVTKTWVFDDLDDEDDIDYEFEQDFVLEVVPADPALLVAYDETERFRLIDAYVRAELARVLRVPPHTIDTEGCPMNSPGIGSINGLELQRRMEWALRLDVNLNMLLRANSAAELIECLAGQLGPGDSPHKRGGQGVSPASHNGPGAT